MQKTIDVLRVAHMIEIFLLFFRILDKIKYGMLVKIVESINLFVYVGAILWALDFVRNIYLINTKDTEIQQGVLWILIEIAVFFLHILSGVVFLFFMQMKGIL